MKRYLVKDDTGEIYDIEAETIDEAIDEMHLWMEDVYFDRSDGTVFYSASLYEVDENGEIIGFSLYDETMELHPDEPACTDGDHDWQKPYELLGGLTENPGVWGKGGGIVYTEVCKKCGLYRTIDTWAQNRDTGEQGLTSISYRAPDEQSKRWAGIL